MNNLTGSPFSGIEIFSGTLPFPGASREAGTACGVSVSGFHSIKPYPSTAHSTTRAAMTEVPLRFDVFLIMSVPLKDFLHEGRSE
ncbi:hypothetical protein CXU16_09960 [Akkermansia muciniphila]|uniref:hypothetical protein n=1 Tax=Akkermansia sp. TaxID=1872421 RepID=UPI000C9BEC67|nr:hypothetical protein CXU16_09960 [Akkermansia muciniphila]